MMANMRERINNPKIAIYISIILTIYFTYLMIKYPLIGIEVEKQNDHWIVNDIYDNGWAAYQQIEKGDIIHLINGKNPEEHDTVTKYNRIEKAESITIIDGNSINEYVIKFIHSDSQFLLLLFPIIFTLLTISLSIFLYYRTNDRSSKILIYFLLTMGICYLSAVGSARGDILGRLLNIITFHIPSFLFIVFMNSYLKRFGLVFLSWIQIVKLYIYNVLLLILIAFILLLNKINFDIRLLELIFFSTIISSLIIYKFYFYIVHKNTSVRNILRILVSSLFIAFSPFVIMYVIPIALSGKQWFSPEIASGFLIIIPITFVYLQIAEKLFDIDFLLNRIRYYLLLSFPYAIALSAVLILFLDDDIPYYLHIGMFCMILVLTTLFLYAKEYIDYKLRNYLFSPKGSLDKSLSNFFQQAKRETRVEDLINRVKVEIKNVLQIKEIASIEINKVGDRYQVTSDKNKFDDRFIQDFKKINWDLYKVGTSVEIMEGYCIILGDELDKKYIIYFSLIDYSTKLNIEEKAWLETLSYYTNILLENIQVIEELFEKIKSYEVDRINNEKSYPNWLSKLLFFMSEKERLNLSIDLHDSLLQDQLQLLRKVEQLYNEISNDSSVATFKQELYEVKEGLLDNIHLTRETCNELRPPLLNEMGIIPSLENLISQVSLRSNFILKADFDQTIKRLDEEQELVIYRVVQELLNNAMKHSYASEVYIKLKKRNSTVLLFYQDNGKGFELNKLQNSYSTIGIFGMQERVKSIDGTILIDSAPGKGTKVTVSFETGGSIFDQSFNSR